MSEWLEATRLITNRLNPILAQSENVLPGNLWKNQSFADPVYVVYFLIGMMLTIIAIVYLAIKYKKWKKFKVFEEELKTLDLDPDTEGTMAGMVKRYAMDEPVQVLCSARLFDEMATSEMLRVLGSPASIKLKEEFIDTVYSIRKRTYHPEWINNDNEADEEIFGESFQESSA